MDFIIEKQLGNPFTNNDACLRFGMLFDKITKYLDLNKNYELINYFNEKWIVTKNQLNKVYNTIIEEVEKFHAENAYQLGVLKKELQQKLAINEIFLNFCINKLIQDSKLVQKEEIISFFLH